MTLAIQNSRSDGIVGSPFQLAQLVQALAASVDLAARLVPAKTVGGDLYVWTVDHGPRIRALLTIACMLALAFTTKFSGSDATLGLAFTHTGWLYPFFAPMLGVGL